MEFGIRNYYSFIFPLFCVFVIETNSDNIDISPLKEIATSIYIKNNYNYKLIHGKKYRTEKIGNYKYLVSPDSFFQININTCFKLYSKIKEYVGVNNKILDLYCGTGSISIFISENNNILGIEINQYAIDDAKENAKLKEENAALKEEVHEFRQLEEHYEWISEYLELKMERQDFKFEPASVCGNESGNYSSVYMLDRGSLNGVAKNMPVLSSGVVMGYISDVGLNWSKATSILEDSSSVGVYDERSGVMGVLEGDYLLASEGLCRMNYLEEGADVKVGDRILTGGYGSVYPRGLTVGYVERVEESEFSRTTVAYVRPAAFDLSGSDKISEVMIITDYESYSE